MNYCYYYYNIIKEYIKEFHNDLDVNSRRCLYFILFIYLSLMSTYFLPSIYNLRKIRKIRIPNLINIFNKNKMLK